MATFNFGMDNVLCLSQSSSIDEDEMERIESDAPESTSHATKSGMKKLINWLKKTENRWQFSLDK